MAVAVITTKIPILFGHHLALFRVRQLLYYGS